MGRTRNRKLGRKTRRGVRKFRNSRKVRKFRGGEGLTDEYYSRLNKEYNERADFYALSSDIRKYYEVNQKYTMVDPYGGPQAEFISASLKPYEQIKQEEDKAAKEAERKKQENAAELQRMRNDFKKQPAFRTEGEGTENQGLQNNKPLNYRERFKEGFNKLFGRNNP